MFTIKKYVVVDSLEEAYKLNKIRKGECIRRTFMDEDG